jgi:hypothetical protein
MLVRPDSLGGVIGMRRYGLATGTDVRRLLVVGFCALVCLVVAATSSARPPTPPAAHAAASFPPYPSTCPIAHLQIGDFYTYAPNCLIDNEAVTLPAGSARLRSTMNQLSSVGITVSPQVVRYGEKFTVSSITSVPPCVTDTVPTPTGCFNKDTGFGGIGLRLLPLTNPEWVQPVYYPSVRQRGHCYSPTRCTFWFEPPQGSGASKLTSHWIVAEIRMTINVGIPQGNPGWIENPVRQYYAETEKAIRLCPPSVPCPSEVSGTVTQQGSSRTGAGGVSVRAACPSGGTTTTDANGHYSFVLNQGQCAISVTPPSGETATPQERRVHVSPSHNMAGVDFQVGCNHGKAARGAAAGSTCLDVSIKEIGQSRSGLAVYPHFAREDPSRAFFLTPYSRVCSSGCTNVLVTVTDPLTHQPVEGATVDASVNAVHGATGESFLCDQVGTRDCGTHLLNSTTDPAGQVHLLYWSPGLVADAGPHINVVARDGTHEGQGELTFTTKPYLIYENAKGTLSRQETLDLAYWPAGKSLLGKLGKLIGGLSGLEKGLSFSLNVLIGAEVAAQRAVQILEGVEAATPIVGALELAHLGSELWERQGFIATFLDALDLNAIGIDDNPIERAVSAAPSAGFEAQLANYGTVAPFHAGAGGLLWEYAKHLDFLFEHHDVAFGAQFLHVKIYEVSYCQLGEICGPGYRTWVGSGIRPELYIEVSAERNRRAQSFSPHAFTISYDPNAWVEAQHNLKGVS